jgi:hypothetical protein
VRTDLIGLRRSIARRGPGPANLCRLLIGRNVLQENSVHITLGGDASTSDPPQCSMKSLYGSPLNDARGRAPQRGLLDPTPDPRPPRVDTLVLFSIRKALAAIDQGRKSVEYPDFSTNQSHTASHLNSSKLVSFDQAAIGLSRHTVALS